MAVKGPYEKPHYFIGLSTDTKPTVDSINFPVIGDEFFEYDTKVWYIFNGSTWSAEPSSTALSMATSTDPATSAAVTTTIVNAYGGVVITTTTTGNAQTIASPTITTAGKIFTVVNNDTSTNSIVVNGVTITAGSSVSFIWDGTAWGQTSIGITAIPVIIAQGGTGQTTAQLAINALTAVSAATNEYILTKDTTTGNAIFKIAAFNPATPGDIGLTTASKIRVLFDEDTIITTGNISANQASGGVINNYAQTADCAMTWPTIVEGQSCVFRCATTVAKYWRVVAPASMYIWLDGVKGSAAGYVGIASATEGACFQIVSIKNTGGTYDLMATTISGTIVAG
jgi:hypothetical protein